MFACLYNNCTNRTGTRAALKQDANTEGDRSHGVPSWTRNCRQLLPERGTSSRDDDDDDGDNDEEDDNNKPGWLLDRYKEISLKNTARQT